MMMNVLTVFLSICSAWVYENNYDVYYRSLFEYYSPAEDYVMQPFCQDSSNGLAVRAQEYAQAWTSFRTGLDFSQCRFWVDSISMQKRAGLERGIVSLLRRPDADSLALMYLSKAPAPYEWEGSSDAITPETSYAMTYLRKNPETPLRPFLLLLLMHRLKAQEECMTLWENVPADSVSALYDSIFTEATNFPDPLVIYLAREMDGQEYVYASP